MSKPTTRVLALLELLQTHGQISGSELGRRLGVDGRTVRRYITVLEDLGIPVTTQQGRHGGYSLVAGFKLPPLMFTEEETLAISLGLLSANGLGLSEIAPAVASAQAKLERVMPATIKGRVRAVSETTRLVLPRAREVGNSILLTLTNAAEQQSGLRFSYLAGDGGTSERDFDPYGLVFRRGRWYVVGMCHLRQDLRTFRVDRIQSLRLRGEHFRRPRDFDPAAHLQNSLSTAQRAVPVEVLMMTDLETATGYLGDYLGMLVPHPEGVLLSSRTDSLDWFARQLMWFPCEFRILSPAALADSVREQARRVLAMVPSGEHAEAQSGG
ncbi:helix-turn-helix transcriptional regulator [Gilvimarinus sp. F26214L]|uniref:helix-turn-helix transcriptional regulator n=1 Tax=Gilvimarinus sp. DZF01 TaxID=3461371 RepID=UPI00404664E9